MPEQPASTGAAQLAAKDCKIADLRAEVARWEEAFPCDAGCVEAAEEDCSRHGRRPAELWQMWPMLQEARAKVAAVEALCAEVDHAATGRRLALLTVEQVREAMASVGDDAPAEPKPPERDRPTQEGTR